MCCVLAAFACGKSGGGQDPKPSAPPPASASSLVVERASASAELVVDAGRGEGALDGGASVDGGPGVDGGPDLDAGAPAPCPDGMAKVGRFCVDRWEDILYEASDAGGAPWDPTRRPEAGKVYEARTMADVKPQGYISRVEASRACKQAGKRLCTMKEWLRACEGKRSTAFPYGEHYVPNRCNQGKAHLLSQKYGIDPSKWTYEAFNDPSLLATPGFLANTGEFDQCVTTEGVFDMVGNLHEWVSDDVDQDFFDRFSAEDVERHPQPWREGNGVFMGGFFSTTDQHGPGCKFTTIAHEPTYHDYSVGFRCCAAATLPKTEPRKKKQVR